MLRKKIHGQRMHEWMNGQGMKWMDDGWKMNEWWMMGEWKMDGWMDEFKVHQWLMKDGWIENGY